MIEWLGGSSRSETKYASGDDGATFIEDAPDTPAPLFVVRAFKTAIFGTPKPIEYKNTLQHSPEWKKKQAADHVQAKDASKGSALQSKGISTVSRTPSQEKPIVRESAIRDRQDPLTSPTKGILLTPGTAATRRKTVSFSARKDPTERAKPADYPIKFNEKPAANSSPYISGASEVPRKQSALTKTLIELSTKRSSPPVTSDKAVQKGTRDMREAQDDVVEYSDKSEAVGNQTLDLNQPCSRSGLHWKAEYDEYHKNSTREMRKLLQHGQNVKSYAARKDSEATNLDEKLKKELAKVARMETKVAKMAKQLRAANVQNPCGDNEQTRLVGELAQQTAMTLRYQKKAEQYRKAIRRLPSNVDVGDQTLDLDENLPQERQDAGDNLLMATMQAQMEALGEVVDFAEKKAARLEDENRRLKRSLARVKDEMTTYDSKRQVKEERLKRRDERHKASKEACEAELAKLKIDYNALLRTSHTQGKAFGPEIVTSGDLLACKDQEVIATLPNTKENPPTINQIMRRQSSNSPRKRRLEKPAVDIWTVESPVNEPKGSIINQNFDIPKAPHEDFEIHGALQEILFNQPFSEPHPTHKQTDERQLPAHTENIKPSTKPISQKGVADDPMGSSFVYQRFGQSSIGRSASLLGNRVGSRTSTMGTARTSSLSAERAAAAKARLAERKKSGEKKNIKREEIIADMR